MTNKTDNLTTELDNSETDFYAKLVPSLLKELSTSRKLLQACRLEHNKTQEVLDKIYKDYQTSNSKYYRLVESVQIWKAVSLCLIALLISSLIFGTM
jgi:hypothetical protein